MGFLKLARLETEKIVEFSSLASSRYHIQKENFVNRHKHRDKEYSVSEYKTIPGHEENCLVYNPKKGEKPWFINMSTLILMDIFALGWI